MSVVYTCTGHDGGNAVLEVENHDPYMSADNTLSRFMHFSTATSDSGFDHEVVAKPAKSKVRSSSKPTKKKVPSRLELEESVL